MYGREYEGRELNFEPSGGLLHASLIMMDKETDTYWSIMSNHAIAGEMAGHELEELAVGSKTQWKEWKLEHPDTKVLSVEGEEHVEANHYDNYFASDQTFDGSEVADARLGAKVPVYGFLHDGKPYAVPFSAFQGKGEVFSIDQKHIFLYRPAGVAVFYSTQALVSDSGFVQRDGHWIELGSGAHFNAKGDAFEGREDSEVQRLGGFDTFWFNWSMNNPETELLSPATVRKEKK